MLPRDLGGGLTLQLTTAADAVEAFAVVDAERVRLREFLPWVDATVDVEVEREFLYGIEQANEAGSGLHATIRSTDGFDGFIGLRLDHDGGCAEVGYWLGERSVGRGYVTRSVAAMFDIAFDELGMERVELLAATDNERSRAVAVRLGMTLEGVRPEAEELARGFVDLAVYSMAASAWPAARRAALAAGSGPGDPRSAAAAEPSN